MQNKMLEYLSEHPDEFIKNADIFAKQFPNIIKHRQEKLNQKKTKSNAKLTEYFEQQSMDLHPSLMRLRPNACSPWHKSMVPRCSRREIWRSTSETGTGGEHRPPKPCIFTLFATKAHAPQDQH